MTTVISVIVSLLIAAVIMYSWPVIQMEFAGYAKYTQQDQQAYEHFTPDILKKIPRISERYDFTYHNIDGPDIQVYALTFYHTSKTKQVSEFLASCGYVKQRSCSTEGECWRGNDLTETVTVSAAPQFNIVLVQAQYGKAR